MIHHNLNCPSIKCHFVGIISIWISLSMSNQIFIEVAPHFSVCSCHWLKYLVVQTEGWSESLMSFSSHHHYHHQASLSNDLYTYENAISTQLSWRQCVWCARYLVQLGAIVLELSECEQTRVKPWAQSWELLSGVSPVSRSETETFYFRLFAPICCCLVLLPMLVKGVSVLQSL